MWTCPKCGHRFVNRNQSHSCGDYTVRRFIEGKSREGVDLFRFFIRQYRKIGTFRLDPVKTRVALLTQMRFCAVNRIAQDHIDVHFVLTEPRRDSPLLRKIDNLGDRFFIHHMRFWKKSDINRKVVQYMKLAYEVGMRSHVANLRTERSRQT